MKAFFSSLFIALSLGIGISVQHMEVTFAVDTPSVTSDATAGRPIINCGERADGGSGILPGCTSGGDALDTGGLVLGRLIPYLISWAIGIMGLIAFFFIVEAGIQLVLSQGNADKAKAAEKTIIAASIGLVIATLSFILVSIASRFNLF